MKRISPSGASVFELLIVLIVIGLSLYYGMAVLMPDSASLSKPAQFKQTDLPAAAEPAAQQINVKNDEQMKAIDEALGRKH